MTLTRERTREVRPADGANLVRRADRYLAIGAIVTGSLFLGMIGLPLMLYGLLLLRRAEATPGVEMRPWTVTIVGLLCGIDTAVNLVGWSIDAIAHDTGLAQAVYAHAYGPIADGAYYIHYNLLSAGGVANTAEKTIQLLSVFFVFPLRLVAAWGFIKMKRWGLHYMIVTSWLYVGIWIAYAIAVSLDFEVRVGASRFGILGWLAANICFIGAFVFLPYLYSVNKSQWASD